MRNRSNVGGDTGGGGRSGGLGATIKRILKIKAIILLILIVLSVFGVMHIIGWFRGIFGDTCDYCGANIAMAEPGVNVAAHFLNM